jgi:hypothetical protein
MLPPWIKEDYLASGGLFADGWRLGLSLVPYWQFQPGDEVAYNPVEEGGKCFGLLLIVPRKKDRKLIVPNVWGTTVHTRIIASINKSAPNVRCLVTGTYVHFEDRDGRSYMWNQTSKWRAWSLVAGLWLDIQKKAKIKEGR